MWPMNLSHTNKQDIRDALDGIIDALNFAFTWDETPQGHDFWMAQYEDGQLTPEGRKALEAMLND
jgi:hypothetical protein